MKRMLIEARADEFYPDRDVPKSQIVQVRIIDHLSQVVEKNCANKLYKIHSRHILPAHRISSIVNFRISTTQKLAGHVERAACCAPLTAHAARNTQHV